MARKLSTEISNPKILWLIWMAT